MDKHQIRLGRTDSVESVNRDNFLGVELKSTFKKLHYNDIKTTVDQYERFALERAECENYRVILTINPYCSNVLFNPLTEVVKNEGSDDVKEERFWSNDVTDRDNVANPGIDGQKTPKRVQMICNTEYSKPLKDGDDKSGYTYMPGYDIFDNHILRDLGFHVVEKPTNNNNQGVFNTIADFEREADGSVVKMYKRANITTKPKKVEKRMHSIDSFLTFEDSVNANLTDENGWFGFINASNLRTTSKNGDLSDICCVINSRKNCEFVEMYPDSTLYSFSPKYNEYRSRLEQNWEVYLTYPFENDYCNELVKGNSLPVLTVENKNGIGGEEIIVFRSYTKHNLKRGDTIKLFYDYPAGGGVSLSEETAARIANVGNASNGDKEYYFYVNGAELTFDADIVDVENVRFRKVYNGMESKYYMRKMKRIESGVVNNAETYYDEDFERYRLAFADTIYGDDITQITFTNTVNIADKVDNLGRPLSEVFVTIVKTNYGNNIWYKSKELEKNVENRNLSDYELNAIEFSHCFGDVTCGYVLSNENTDRTNEGIMKSREHMRDARTINNNQRFGSNMPQTFVNGKDALFDGDIVEFSPEDCMEHVLSDCVFRFNTYQRENPTSDDFRYHEIKTDIYDTASFEVDLKRVTPNLSRDEGYYHKAHYPLKIRGFGGVMQNGHNDIRVVDAHPVRAEKILISVKATLPTKLNNGDTIYLCDDKNGLSFEFQCTGVQSPTTFRMIPKMPVCEDEEHNNCETNPWVYFNSQVSQHYEGNPKINWVNLSQMLKTGQLKLRGRNYDIPDYAVKTGNNTYMWRNVLPYGEITDDEVPEYTFANNAFYLTPTIRFYLKRQDPDGMVGLYAKEDFPNDIYGNIKKASNYYYEEEIDNGC